MSWGQGVVGDYLEPITSAAKVRPFLTVDIESKDEDTQKPGFTRPFLIGAYVPTHGTYVEFRNEPHLASRSWRNRATSPGGCVDKMMQFLLTPAFSKHLIYAHNGGNFDHLFWLRWLREHDDEYGFEVIPVQSTVQMISVWRKPESEDEQITDRWEFLDSMKLFPSGLNSMLKTFNLGGKVEHDLAMHEDDPRWSVYLKQDCVGLAEGVKKIYELIARLGGEVGMTAPSTAMKLFRRKYLGRKMKRIPRYTHFPDCKSKALCEGCLHEWVRRGYYGGRTEIFCLIAFLFRYFDLNSSYVAAMCAGMPVGERRVETSIDWRLMKNYAGFAECTVRIPETCDIPPLPHRSRETGKLIFPVGVFHGVWSLEELELLSDASVKGEILNVVKVVWFKRVEVFKEMMEELWAYRDKTREGYDEGLSALAKLMGNSLYGKFGMKKERTSIVFRRKIEKLKCFLCGEPSEGGLCMDCEGSKPASEREDDVWYQHKTVEASYIIPQIAAHITALARVRLWRYMRQAVDAGGELIYVDTDSILTTADLPSSSRLGELKDEYPGKLLDGRFVQPKVYMITEKTFEKPKVTMKGFPKSLRTKENLEALERGESISYKNLEKVRSLARKGFKTTPEMVTVTKSFHAKCVTCGCSLSTKDVERKKRCRLTKAPCIPGPSYDKRKINPDGRTTRPLVLNEWPSSLEAADAAAEE